MPGGCREPDHQRKELDYRRKEQDHQRKEHDHRRKELDYRRKELDYRRKEQDHQRKEQDQEMDHRRHEKPDQGFGSQPTPIPQLDGEDDPEPAVSIWIDRDRSDPELELGVAELREKLRKRDIERYGYSYM